MQKLSKAKRKILRLEREGKQWIRWTNGNEGAVFDPNSIADSDLLRFSQIFAAKIKIHISASPNTLSFKNGEAINKKLVIADGERAINLHLPNGDLPPNYGQYEEIEPGLFRRVTDS
jgi:hypothetical protein